MSLVASQAPGAESGPESGPEPCSARDCRAPAEWALLWNNARLHTPERRKVWLACGTHRESLADFLGGRGMLREVVAHVPGTEYQPSTAAPPPTAGAAEG